MNHHNEIYEKLVSLFKIKFKAQLKDSPIEFNQLFLVKNIINDIEFYLLIFNNQKSIEFENRNEFISEFIKYLNFEIKELEDEFDSLDGSNDSILNDKNYIFDINEDIGHGAQKLQQIIDKLEKQK